MNTIFTRRSIREFENRAVEQEKIDKILRAGMQAPSARNRQPWQFIVVTDKKIKEDVLKFSPYAGVAANAGAIIIILGEFADVPGGAFVQQDVGACTQNILLQIVEEGLGGLWIGCYPNQERADYLIEYFNLPENIIPVTVVAAGYSEQKNEFVDRYNPDKIHYNNY